MRPWGQPTMFRTTLIDMENLALEEISAYSLDTPMNPKGR